MKDKQELTIREFADAIGYSQSGVKNWIAKNKIKSRLAYIKQRPTRLIPVDELDRIMEKQKKNYIPASPTDKREIEPDFTDQTNQDKLIPIYNENLVNLFRESVQSEIQALKDENKKLWAILNDRMNNSYLDPWRALIEKLGKMFLFLLSPFNAEKSNL